MSTTMKNSFNSVLKRQTKIQISPKKDLFLVDESAQKNTSIFETRMTEIIKSVLYNLHELISYGCIWILCADLARKE